VRHACLVENPGYFWVCRKLGLEGGGSCIITPSRGNWGMISEAHLVSESSSAR
jgi:hypothetical protein